MPGLPFRELPATRQDPLAIIQGRYKDTQRYVRSQYANEVKNLESQVLTDVDFQTQLNQLNSKYQGIINQETHKINQQLEQLQTVQTLVKQGLITPDAGQRAAWRMTLPSEAEQAMFPVAPKGRVPFTPAGLRGYREFITPFAEAAKTSGWGLTGYKREQSDLIRQYLAAREQAGYDDPTWTPTQKRQFDTEWDDLMASDRDYKWNPEAPEIKSLRAVGKLQRAVAENITPLGASVRKKVMFKPRYGLPGGPPSTEIKPKARYARNPNTGEQIVSYDGGKTWQSMK